MKILVLLLACAQWTVTESQSRSWTVTTYKAQEGASEATIKLPAVVETEPQKLQINVYSAPFFCPPCEALKRDMPNFPLVNWVELPAPPWVTTYPTIRWQTESGEWRYRDGWDGVAAFEKELLRFNPVFAKARSEYKSRKNVKSTKNRTVERSVTAESEEYELVPYEELVTEQVPAYSQGAAVWGGRSYSGRVCTNPNCRMCNSIQSQLSSSNMTTRTVTRKVIRYKKVPKKSRQKQNLRSETDPSQEPTPYDVVSQLIGLTPRLPNGCHADLGCGDGRILIEAIHQGWGRAIGVEIDPDKAEEARENIRQAGMSDRISVITGDVLDFEPSAHSVNSVSAYLYPDLLGQLIPKFLQVDTVVTPYHSVSGLEMSQHGDVFVYHRS